MRKHLLASLFVLGLSVLTLYANVRIPFAPDLGGGIPAYASIQRLANGDVLVPNDGVWAAITFYRDPACVPVDFNLLNLFDPGALLGCTLTVEGFEIWRNGPWAGDLTPIQTISHGLGAVPIWFVKLCDLEDAVSDDNLTVEELEGLASLKKGSAVFFIETKHPYDGEARVVHIEVSARGVLQDGEQFQFQVTGGPAALIGHVHIVFW